MVGNIRALMSLCVALNEKKMLYIKKSDGKLLGFFFIMDRCNEIKLYR